MHSRAIYNILDFLGDVGGLLDALKLIAGTLVGLIVRGNLTGKLVSLLFYEDSAQDKDQGKKYESG